MNIGPSVRQVPPLWLLVLITASGTLGIHIFAPGLTVAAAALGASFSDMQLTISVYAFGLAIGQLVYGPLSDRFGRRPTLLAGLALFTVAGFAAALADQVWTLIAARLFQALGACAGVALGRAIVRDSTSNANAAASLAMLNLCVAAIPAFAPVLGGVLASWFGWRAVLWLLAVAGLALLLLGFLLLVETRQASQAPASLRADYLRLLRSPAFLGFTLGGGCATTAIYAFLATMPFILTTLLQQPVAHVGFYYPLLAGGVVLGSVIARNYTGRVGMDRLLLTGSLLGLLGSTLFLVALITDSLSVVSMMVPMVLFTIGNGIASPLALTKATGLYPRVIGSASGLYGCGQQAVGALCTALAAMGAVPALSAAVVMVVAAAIGQVALRLALRAGVNVES